MDADTRSGSSGTGVSAVVEYDYTAKEPDELDLIRGDLIHSIRQMPGGWWEGTLQSSGKAGMFPDNFVRIMDINDDHNVVLRDKTATTNRRCKVIYSYTQVNDDELTLAMGDVIEFLGEVEEGWWRGRLKNKIGVFPSNFVVKIEPSPIFASKRPPSSGIAMKTEPTANFSSSVSSSSANTSTYHSVTNAASSSSFATHANTVSNNIKQENVLASSSKKTNRLSFHSSKEDLLSSSSLSNNTATTLAATSLAAADDVAPSLPPKPLREFCRVEFPYAPQNVDELYLRTGDIITIISMELPDKGWWKGELRGKVGVFPDNFVKLLAPSEVSPLNDSQFGLKTAKNANVAATAAATTTPNITSTSSATTTTTSASASTTKTTQAASTSKVFIKKSGSSASTQSSQGQNTVNHKDSFGSRDSLNDILSETGLQSGNVAATRKSLENKNLDLLNAPDASSRLVAMKKQQQESVSITTATTTATTISSSSNSSSSEMRKSLENLDDKTKSPPPVLTKKPMLGAKNILSGLKQKVKNVEKTLTTAASHDYADGIASSKISPSSGLPDAGPNGNVVMRRAATIAVEDIDFDSVERTSILPDMRAGRVKAPRRRPPSAAYNIIGESNNNNSALSSSDENSTGDEQLVKPKPRKWQTKNAPWMAELKASQVKKKTSPNVEPRSMITGSSSAHTTTATERTKHIVAEDTKITSSNSNSSNSSTSTTGSNVISSSTTTSSSTSAATTSTKVQSSSISSTLMQQSMSLESSHQLLKKELLGPDAMTKSMSTARTILAASNVAEPSSEDVLRTRPNSLSLRNRSSSPSSLARTAAKPPSATTASSSSSSTNAVEATSNSNASLAASTSSAAAKMQANNNHSNENNISALGKHAHITNSNSNSNSHSNSHANSKVEGVRVVELEKRVEKLESVVQSQQRTIDELVRTLREETDRVKLLRGELDKYAQCVTQV